MTTDVVQPDVAKRTPTWRVLMWAGVVGSVLAWALVWYLGRGPSVIMLLFALAAVALSFRATAGYRWALVGMILVSLVMFLASLYWMAMLYTDPVAPVSVVDVMVASVVPLVAAIVLFAGAAVGFRHAR